MKKKELLKRIDHLELRLERFINNYNNVIKEARDVSDLLAKKLGYTIEAEYYVDERFCTRTVAKRPVLKEKFITLSGISGCGVSDLVNIDMPEVKKKRKYNKKKK